MSDCSRWWSEAWSPYLYCLESEGGIERAVAEGQQGLDDLTIFQTVQERKQWRWGRILLLDPMPLHTCTCRIS